MRQYTVLVLFAPHLSSKHELAFSLFWSEQCRILLPSEQCRMSNAMPSTDCTSFAHDSVRISFSRFIRSCPRIFGITFVRRSFRVKQALKWIVVRLLIVQGRHRPDFTFVPTVAVWHVGISFWFICPFRVILLEIHVLILQLGNTANPPISPYRANFSTSQKWANLVILCYQIVNKR